MTSDLAHNPFHLLRLAVTARRDAVAEAYEEALADGRADENELARAQQTIMAPRSRIDAEISWFLTLPAAKASMLVEELEPTGVPWRSDLLDGLGLKGLDRANFAAELAARGPAAAGYVRELIEAYNEFGFGSVLETLSALRQVSGFPPPDLRHLRTALEALRDTHAKKALAAIKAAGEPGAVLTDLIAEIQDHTGGSRELLAAIVSEYDAWSVSFLTPIQQKIEAQISPWKTGATPAAPSDLDGLLGQWNAVSRPVQVFEQSMGLEEPRSKALYACLRDLSLELSNTLDRHEDALTITRLLQQAFPTLPAASDQLRRDIAALELLAEQSKLIPLLSPLHAARQMAERAMASFRSDVAYAGFGIDAIGLAKALHVAFAEATAKTTGTPRADEPWLVVRELAIELNNTLKATREARVLIDALLDHPYPPPSQFVTERLCADQQMLERNEQWGELKQTPSGHTRKLQLISRLLDGASVAERDVLLSAKHALERKRLVSRVRIGILMLLLTAVGVPLAYEAATSPRRPPFEEILPRQGQALTLGTSEVRYCVFQGTRLDILRDLAMSDSEIERFNTLIGDYNSRCADYRYRAGVLQSVQAELPGRREVLREDAFRILALWRQPTAPPAPPLLDLTTLGGASMVQRRLKELGYYSGVVDGIWGARSKAALLRFKVVDPSLVDDGVWDLATQHSLLAP